MTSPAHLQVSKKGLTNAGVVLFQTLFIGLSSVIEVVIRHGIGVYTGVVICLAVIGTIRLGRTGTEYAAAATSPLAFALITLIATALLDGFHISKVGVDFVASLASAAPYLVVAIAIGWVNFFRSRR